MEGEGEKTRDSPLYRHTRPTFFEIVERGGCERYAEKWKGVQFWGGSEQLPPRFSSEFGGERETAKATPGTDTLLRELGSIHRSDLCLVVSPFEKRLLESEYNFPSQKLALSPFYYPNPPHTEFSSPPSTSSTPRPSLSSTTPFLHPLPFHERHNFLFVGNFRHPPNRDAVNWLSSSLWPSLRQRVKEKEGKEVECVVVGAYPSHVDMGLNSSKNGFNVRGPVDDEELQHLMNTSRVSLVPVRFGAGIKGKIAHSWFHGLPVCSTPLGAEGMTVNDTTNEEQFLHIGEHTYSFQKEFGDEEQWGGLWKCGTGEDFVQNAMRLYTEKDLWESCVRRGYFLNNKLYNENQNNESIAFAIRRAFLEKDERRKADHVWGMLWHHSLRSTEYMSRWIETKTQFQKLKGEGK